MSRTVAPARAEWPELVYEEWKDTLETLHLWTQVVGKVRLAQTPWINHSWHVPLYVTARGLTTSPVPYGARTFEIAFDFLDHRLRIDVDDGASTQIALRPNTVADFHREVLAALAGLGIDVSIRTMPCEIPEAVPFDQDRTHASYDADAATRFWRALLRADRVFKTFRSRYAGKVSPVHLFWGGLDLAVTRFSGRPAPPHPGGVPNMADWVAREAYSHEVSSCGFWPGAAQFPEAIFYSYAYPEPEGFRDAPVRPASARFDTNLGEFVLPYAAVRAAADPDDMLLEFLQSTYEAAAELGRWDRESLEAAFPPECFRSAPAEPR
jgi:Family of unknown function (DUF5996)